VLPVLVISGPFIEGWSCSQGTTIQFEFYILFELDRDFVHGLGRFQKPDGIAVFAGTDLRENAELTRNFYAYQLIWL
jgi:hypothetical protein